MFHMLPVQDYGLHVFVKGKVLVKKQKCVMKFMS